MENIYENANTLMQQDLIEQNMLYYNNSKKGINAVAFCVICKYHVLEDPTDIASPIYFKFCSHIFHEKCVPDWKKCV